MQRKLICFGKIFVQPKINQHLSAIAPTNDDPGLWRFTGPPGWRLQMETFSTLQVFGRGIHQWQVDSPHRPVTGEFPSQRPMTGNFYVFFDLCMNKRFSKNRNAGELRRHRAHYGVTVMLLFYTTMLADHNLLNCCIMWSGHGGAAVLFPGFAINW